MAALGSISPGLEAINARRSDHIAGPMDSDPLVSCKGGERPCFNAAQRHRAGQDDR
jgi:hypothetical protein